jgi:hypothetical protein
LKAENDKAPFYPVGQRLASRHVRPEAKTRPLAGAGLDTIAPILLLLLTLRGLLLDCVPVSAPLCAENSPFDSTFDPDKQDTGGISPPSVSTTPLYAFSLDTAEMTKHQSLTQRGLETEHQPLTKERNES